MRELNQSNPLFPTSGSRVSIVVDPYYPLVSSGRPRLPFFSTDTRRPFRLLPLIHVGVESKTTGIHGRSRPPTRTHPSPRGHGVDNPQVFSNPHTIETLLTRSAGSEPYTFPGPDRGSLRPRGLQWTVPVGSRLKPRMSYFALLDSPRVVKRSIFTFPFQQILYIYVLYTHVSKPTQGPLKTSAEKGPEPNV